MKWRTKQLDFAPTQNQMGTCLPLALAMGMNYEVRRNRRKEKVYRFTFYTGYRAMYDIDSGTQWSTPGRKFTVTRADRDDLTGFTTGVWGDFERTYAEQFGADTLRGDYVTNAMPRFGAPVVDAETVVDADDVLDALRLGGKVIFVSDNDTDSVWFHDLHAYRVLQAGPGKYEFINPWSQDSAKGFTQGANDGRFTLTQAELVAGGEAYGTFYIGEYGV